MFAGKFRWMVNNFRAVMKTGVTEGKTDNIIAITENAEARTEKANVITEADKGKTGKIQKIITYAIHPQK